MNWHTLCDSCVRFRPDEKRGNCRTAKAVAKLNHRHNVEIGVLECNRYLQREDDDALEFHLQRKGAAAILRGPITSAEYDEAIAMKQKSLRP